LPGLTRQSISKSYPAVIARSKRDEAIQPLVWSQGGCWIASLSLAMTLLEDAPPSPRAGKS
jgi:hypothetical protein